MASAYLSPRALARADKSDRIGRYFTAPHRVRFWHKADIGKRAARSARSLLCDPQHANSAQSGRNRLAVSCLPAPGTGAIPASRYALLVDLRDHLAIAGKQRLSRAVTTRRRLMPHGTSFSFLQAVTHALHSMQRSASQRNFIRAMIPPPQAAVI